MKTNRIPFTLKDYESRKYKVVTRDGRSARIVCTDCLGENTIVALVKCQDGSEDCFGYHSDGSFVRTNNSCYDLFLEKISFEDGDIVTSDANCRIGIIGLNNCYDVILYSSGTLRYGSHCYLFEPRLATEEEKQRLFNALAKDGMRWNSEKKLIEYIEEECELKPFQKVLVRGYDYTTWKPSLFGYYVEDDKFPYRCIGGSYIQCIPYEGNEELLGTDNNPLL